MKRRVKYCSVVKYLRQFSKYSNQGRKKINIKKDLEIQLTKIMQNLCLKTETNERSDAIPI